MENAPKRTTAQMSITLPIPVKTLADLVLTPPGFMEVPKGSYSQLIGTLLTGYLENTFETDIGTIYDIFGENPTITAEELKREIYARKQAALEA